jgi:hypothetical protein
MPDEDTFQVACPRCGDTFNVPILLLDKKAQCPGCGAKFAMEPPPGPAGRELRARAAQAREAAAASETGSVHIPLKGAQKAPSRPSTNTVKLARFKAGAEENQEKLLIEIFGREQSNPYTRTLDYIAVLEGLTRCQALLANVACGAVTYALGRGTNYEFADVGKIQDGLNV